MLNKIPVSLKIEPTLQDCLKRCLLCEGLQDEELGKIERTSHVTDLAANEVLFQQGDKADRFYLLIAGMVKLYRLSEGGQEKIMDLISPGGTFAEAVIFHGQAGFPVNAAALKDSKVLSIDAHQYLEILKNNTSVCLALLARMSQRLHWQIQEIDKLTLHSATYRLVNYLIDEIPSHMSYVQSVSIDTPKHVIASRLSISPETLSRILAKLKKQGLLETQKSHIVISDVAHAKEFLLTGKF
ncbi:MAG: Crp/Fnr family transcriptional regulator [bacterium]